MVVNVNYSFIIILKSFLVAIENLKVFNEKHKSKFSTCLMANAYVNYINKSMLIYWFIYLCCVLKFMNFFILKKSVIVSFFNFIEQGSAASSVGNLWHHFVRNIPDSFDIDLQVSYVWRDNSTNWSKRITKYNFYLEFTKTHCVQ